MVVFLVLVKMTLEVFDPRGQQRDLHPGEPVSPGASWYSLTTLLVCSAVNDILVNSTYKYEALCEPPILALQTPR